MTLAACQQLPRLPPSLAPTTADQHRSGRLAVRVQGNTARSFTADFELDGSPSAGQLSLSTPLGTRMAEAQWQPGRAWLSSNDGVREFSDLDGLAQEALGERVPLAALFDWLAGKPSPVAASATLAPPAEGFSQLGWEVRLEGWRDGLVVATRLTPPTVTVRAKLDTVPGADTGKSNPGPTAP